MLGLLRPDLLGNPEAPGARDGLRPGLRGPAVAAPAPLRRQTSFPAALEEIRKVVGDEQVSADPESLRKISRTTLAESTLPRAIVRPESTEQVQAVVRIANRARLSLYPVSCGRNWGYGDACAATAGQLILELKRMNRILEVDAELGSVTVEPGVTQGQLQAHLEERGLPFWADATGAGPGASLVGNTLERGFGHSPNGDRFLNSCGMEVVLADGRVLRTGFGHYENARAAGAFKWGLGPYLDGLFTQSNLGIVTRMTFWLLPKPECFRAFIFSVAREADLGPLVEALRPLRLSGTLKSTIHIFNDLRLLGAAQGYPWAEMGGRTPLSDEVAARLMRRHRIRAWTGSGGLYGTRAEVAAAAQVLRRALKGVKGLVQLVFLDEARLRLAETAVALLARVGLGRSLAPFVRKARLGLDLLRGRASAECLRGGLWRVRPSGAGRPADSLDPLDHNAGFLWIAPVLPMTRAHVDRFAALLKPIFARHGFEYQATFSLVTARALCAVLTIAYDRANPAEALSAQRCHDEVWKAVLEAGYIPYRAGNAAMPLLDQGSAVFWDLVAQLKGTLDPNGVLSPGHYEPARARGAAAGLTR